MHIGKSRSWVLLYPAFGFALVVLLNWSIEFSGVAQRVFGGERHVPDWRSALLQTVVLTMVAAVVVLVMRRLMAHLLYLEGFLRVCAWCRKVRYKDQWLRLEDYFEQGFHVGTTHGMCPQCVTKMEAANAEFQKTLKRGEGNAMPPPREGVDPPGAG